MIAGYHVIFGAYGFWLPNDPRGSGSNFVGSWELFRYGPATKTAETRSVAHREHDQQLRLAAKQALKYPAVVFDDQQIEAVATGFGRYFRRSRVPAWACAIMPDHVHLVVGRLKIKIEQFVIQIKGDATQALKKAEIHPLKDYRDNQGRIPKCFGRGQWKVFLDADEIPRTIRYVENNPIKEGRDSQIWPFVTPYEPD